jgi:pimeloyl-ACP methyl ester carboxylesterase
VLHRETTGSGEPLVIVHGSWADSRHWLRVATELEDSFEVILYDRRGHGRSGGAHTRIADDVDDLAGLLTGPAHVVAGSFGGSVALRLATSQPDLLKSLSVHEPALPGLLGGAPQGGPATEELDPRAFAESSLGEGAWEWLTDEEREGFRANGQAWRDEMGDAEALSIDAASLAAFDRPAMISVGSEGSPLFRAIADALAGALPDAEIRTVDGAGHLPHLTHARDYAELLRSFATAAAARR